MSEKEGSEKRIRPRIEVKIQVIMDDSEQIHTVTGDLSKNGVFLRTPFPFAQVGEKLSLKIAMADSDEFFKLKGKVVRVNQINQVNYPAGIAIAFDKVDARYSKNFESMLIDLFKGKGQGCRKHPRAQIDLEVDLEHKTIASQRVFTQNISMGGMFIKVDKPQEYTLGDLIKVQFIHPSTRRKFLVYGEVVHIKSFDQNNPQQQANNGLGVKLVRLSDKRKEDLMLYFRSILNYQKRSKK